MESIGQHFYPSWCSSDFCYSLASRFWQYYFHWKVLGIEFCLFYWKTMFSFRIYRYVCNLILNVHVGSEMHIVLHQKWGHAGRPHNVSLWIGFKSFRLLNCHNLFLVGTSSQKRRKGNQELSDQQLWSWMNYREALKDGRLLLDLLPKILYLPTWLYPGIQASAWLKMLSVQT